MLIFFIGMCTAVLGVAGIEGTIPLWQGFLISFSGLVIMFAGIVKMAYVGSDYIDLWVWFAWHTSQPHHHSHANRFLVIRQFTIWDILYYDVSYCFY